MSAENMGVRNGLCSMGAIYLSNRVVLHLLLRLLHHPRVFLHHLHRILHHVLCIRVTGVRKVRSSVASPKEGFMSEGSRVVCASSGGRRNRPGSLPSSSACWPGVAGVVRWVGGSCWGWRVGLSRGHTIMAGSKFMVDPGGCPLPVKRGTSADRQLAAVSDRSGWTGRCVRWYYILLRARLAAARCNM